MTNKLILNIFINSAIAIIFVTLNILSLKNGFEETFIFLAFCYGFLTIVINAIFISLIINNK